MDSTASEASDAVFPADAGIGGEVLDSFRTHGWHPAIGFSPPRFFGGARKAYRMYLSHVPLNTARRSAVALLGSPQRIHAAVLTAFPGETDQMPAGLEFSPAKGEGRVLWRIDRSGPKANLFVVSPERPDFTSLIEQAGWPCAENPARTADYGRFLDRLEPGQSWAFRLTANPVTTTLDQARNKKVRVPHVTVAQQTKWFSDRAEQNGITIKDVLIDDRRRLEFRRGDKTVTLASVSYRGTLDVVDSTLLRAMLVNGIGKGKGYGLGLMTLANAS